MWRRDSKHSLWLQSYALPTNSFFLLLWPVLLSIFGKLLSSVPEFHCRLITFLTARGYWAVLSPLTSPTILGKWLLNLSVWPGTPPPPEPQTHTCSTLPASDSTAYMYGWQSRVSACWEQNSSPPPWICLSWAPQSYTLIILDSSFPPSLLTWSQLESHCSPLQNSS